MSQGQESPGVLSTRQSFGSHRRIKGNKMKSNAISQTPALPRTIPHRFCEFVKVDEKNDYIGAYRNSEAWEEACQRPAEHIFYFKNHTAYLCGRHYDCLIAWVEEN